MKSVWRIVLMTGGLAVLGIAFFVIRGNLRTDGFLASVRSKDAAGVRRALESQPDLVTTLVMPQGSRSIDGRTRWAGRTVMHEMVSTGAVEVAETLHAFNADFSVRMDGDTLLHVAADAGDVPMMTWLLDHGSDVNIRNNCAHPEKAVCASGAFADWQPFDRGRASSPTICKGCDRDGQTPLHAAQRSIHAFEGSTLLLARGADVHATDAAGQTALHVAAQIARASQDPRVLCAYGSDPMQRDRNGKTPADLARESDLAKSVDRYSSSRPGELAGWLQPGGGCARIAARARPGAPVSIEAVDAEWGAYVCTRDAQYCAK